MTNVFSPLLEQELSRSLSMNVKLANEHHRVLIVHERVNALTNTCINYGRDYI